MVNPHPSSLDDEKLLSCCEIQRLRRSGPGGQHRNKVESAVLIIHKPSGNKAEANERRSQKENMSVAIRRLRIRLAGQIRNFRPPDQVPSELWEKHCQHEKLSISLNSRDYPALLAEALDLAYQENLDLKKAASMLRCSVSQLIKFLKKEPELWHEFNQARKQKGLHAYH